MKKTFRNYLLIPIITAGIFTISACALSRPLTTFPTSTSMPTPEIYSPTAPAETHLAVTDTATAIITTPSPLPSPTPVTVKFAIIGDFGNGSQAEADVANLIKSWGVDFIITVGDNNYPNGSAETIDEHIGKYYSDFIYPYHGSYGKGSDTNRFFPALGNHEWIAVNVQPHLDYFELPGNERYYDFTWESLHFFAVDSDSNEPDGVSRISIQANWLKEALAKSTSKWNIVYMHHPPYTSGKRGPVDWMRWYFQEWGASIVFSGHDHFYERLLVNDFPYVINGLGGGPIYWFGETSPYSQKRYNGDWGAILGIMEGDSLSFQFITRSGEVIDSFSLEPQMVNP